jgi:hypothetical protein
MVNRYSSRLSRLDESFLNKKLSGAKSYDRIAGYFVLPFWRSPARVLKLCPAQRG